VTLARPVAGLFAATLHPVTPRTKMADGPADWLPTAGLQSPGFPLRRGLRADTGRLARKEKVHEAYTFQPDSQRFVAFWPTAKTAGLSASLKTGAIAGARRYGAARAQNLAPEGNVFSGTVRDAAGVPVSGALILLDDATGARTSSRP
jgi:hypothetical protein